jgi:hypothetical protein
MNMISGYADAVAEVFALATFQARKARPAPISSASPRAQDAWYRPASHPFTRAGGHAIVRRRVED